ncbi:uncharacterized protein LOC118189779 [Stegodyphus dumicola]|uniref:uncharacterized protein LOC118189779 n=1 Tax=Stegodyphus dumicola TaxID=202533 RepID=UPI0015B35873|nr:uncharacterized protein LOC118189779 [Stegodyphus dumicola]
MLILSINLNHCSIAAAQLPVIGEITGSIPDIICLQEPYLINGNLASINNSLRLAMFPGGRTAIIVLNEKIDCTFDLQTDIITGITVHQSKIFSIFSCYFFPAEDISAYIAKLEDICENFKDFLIFGDFSARHTCWGAPNIDPRGSIVFDFLAANNVLLINSPDSPPTFSSTIGTGWTDLVSCSPEMNCSSESLEISQEESLSDHKYLILHLDFETRKKDQTGITKNVYRISRFCENFRRKISNFTGRLINTDSPCEINVIIDELLIVLKTGVESKLKSKPSRGKEYRWWTPELTRLRRRVRAMRKRSQVWGIPDHEKDFRKTDYKRELAF